ncbi:MAG: chorismate synthase, partial [Clostridia bacterium]|nr:chorismate synthase [Clostridia bacterium]
MPNPFGNNLKLDICGGSHDPEITMTFAGLPAGIAIDKAHLQAFMARRAPGQNAWSSTRREADAPEFLGGLTERNGMLYTDGTPIRARIRNTNARPSDYDSDVP